MLPSVGLIATTSGVHIWLSTPIRILPALTQYSILSLLVKMKITIGLMVGLILEITCVSSKWDINLLWSIYMNDHSIFPFTLRVTKTWIICSWKTCFCINNWNPQNTLTDFYKEYLGILLPTVPLTVKQSNRYTFWSFHCSHIRCLRARPLWVFILHITQGYKHMLWGSFGWITIFFVNVARHVATLVVPWSCYGITMVVDVLF